MDAFHRSRGFPARVERRAERGRGARNRCMGPCFRRRSRVDFRPLGLAPPRPVHASGRHVGLFRREPEDHFASGLCSTRFTLKPSSARDGRRGQNPAGRLHWLGGQSPGPRRTSSPQGQSAFRPARGSSPSLPPKLSRSTDPRRRVGAWILAPLLRRRPGDYAGGAGGRGIRGRRFFFVPGPVSFSRREKVARRAG